jgi:hypothetical protein
MPTVWESFPNGKTLASGKFPEAKNGQTRDKAGRAVPTLQESFLN